MKTISRYIMTLALLLTAVTGAWASGEIVVTVTAADLQADLSNPFTKNGVTIKCSDRMSGGLAFNELNEMSTTLGYFTKIEITNQFPEGISGINGINGFSVNGSVATWTGKASSVGLGHYSVGPVVQFVFTIEPSGPEVTWNPATKTGTFTMPAFDVEIAPIYAPVAQWAKVDNVDQLPTAIEGIYAESTDAIVKAGTVAKIGETENVQGTLMYAVGTSATEQPALTAFSATLPTAKDITTAGDVWVWYYIKGADTPEGQTATAENTFNDSEICETPIKVTLLSNKFDITFKAANANTIEAGKATVTVGGTAATVTEGKLEGVKMGSEVKMTAKEGYKFRKVELQGWQRKGLGTITDGLFMSLFSRPDITVHCNVYENVNTPGLYKIDGFQCALVAAFYGISEEEMRQYEGGNWRNVKILIDATNPEKVSISDQDYGIQVNSHYGFIRIQSEATGKLVDNVITFPSNEMYVGFTGLGDWYYGNVNGTFKIMLPK